MVILLLATGVLWTGCPASISGGGGITITENPPAEDNTPVKEAVTAASPGQLADYLNDDKWYQITLNFEGNVTGALNKNIVIKAPKEIIGISNRDPHRISTKSGSVDHVFQLNADVTLKNVEITAYNKATVIEEGISGDSPPFLVGDGKTLTLEAGAKLILENAADGSYGKTNGTGKVVIKNGGFINDKGEPPNTGQLWGAGVNSMVIEKGGIAQTQSNTVVGGTGAPIEVVSGSFELQRDGYIVTGKTKLNSYSPILAPGHTLIVNSGGELVIGSGQSLRLAADDTEHNKYPRVILDGNIVLGGDMALNNAAQTANFSGSGGFIQVTATTGVVKAGSSVLVGADGILVPSDSGIVELTSAWEYTIKGSKVTLGTGKTLTVPLGKTLKISSGATLEISGTLTNNGTVANNGTIKKLSSGVLDGTGLMTGNMIITE
jgi:hypothetical protein